MHTLINPITPHSTYHAVFMRQQQWSWSINVNFIMTCHSVSYKNVSKHFIVFSRWNLKIYMQPNCLL